MKLYLRGKTWWVTNGSGDKLFRASTGRKDYDEAMAVAKKLCAPSQLEDDADKLEFAAVAAASMRKRAAEERSESLDIPLDDVPKLFPYCNPRRTIKESSVKMAAFCWDLFARFCHSRKIHHLNEVTAKIADAFLQSQSTTRRMVTLSYIYCRRFCEMAGLNPNPFQNNPLVDRSETVHHQPLSHDQIRAVLAKADDLAARKTSSDAAEFAVFLRFLIYTGLRLGDAATCKVSDVDFSANPPMLSRMMAKTSRPVRFPLHPALIDRLPREGEYLFPSMAHFYHLRGSTVCSHRIRRIFAAVGIDGDAYEYSAHSLRTTFASICAENGVPIAAIQSWLGHTSPMVTRIYTNLENDRAKTAALSRFPSLD